MGQRPKRQCSEPGCFTLTRQSKCEQHAKQVSKTRRVYDATPGRRADHRFYSSDQWRRVRRSVLASNPLCVRCQERGRTTAATEVHHVVPRKTAPDLAFETANLMPLCRACHNAEATR